MKSKEEKKSEFLAKAAKNKANFELHQKIVKELGITVSDQDFLKLIDYAEYYHDIIENTDKELIREVLMRHQLLFPCNEQDLKWSEQKPTPELMERLLKVMKLDKIDK